jgi:glycosyltransferase involved in cell wall biosynthesis
MTAEPPRISIILASYNHEAYIERTLVSVISQTHCNWELLITDDGSSDATPSIIKKYAENDPRIKAHYFQENKGACVAIANCYSRCQSEFLSMINSDDTWQPEKLERQIHHLQQHPEIGAVFSRVNVIDGNDERINHHFSKMFNQPKNRSRLEWLNHFFYEGNCLCHPSLLIRKSCYTTSGGIYKKELAALPDFDMWVRLCMHYEIYILEDKLVNFRILNDEQNESAATNENIIRDAIEQIFVLQNYLHIDSCSNINEIFPDSPPIKDPNLIPYYVAKQALQHNNPSHKLFGLFTLYELMRDESNVSRLSGAGFNYTDLHKLSKQTDFFGLSRATEKKRRTNKSKYRIYRKLFIFSMVLNLLLFLT